MKPFTYLAAICLINSTFCQVAQDNIIGKVYTFEVEDSPIQIDVQIYSESANERKDLLVILDGQRLFTYGVSLAQTFKQFRLSPDLMIVGISTPYPQRFRMFTRNSKELQSFINEQLLPFLLSNHDISNNKILFGWEYGGSMVIQSFIENPNLFDSYITASPFPIDAKLEELDSVLNSQKIKSSLYFTVENEDGMVLQGVEKLRDLLQNKEDVNWKYNFLEDEEHRSTPYVTLYHGLRNYYAYYPEIHFNSLTDFEDTGGLDFVYEYYNKRSDQFGFPGNPTPWTMFSITRTAMRANDYEKFNSFVKEFEPSEFLTQIRLNRALSIADFYAEKGNPSKVIDIYSLLAEANPQSEAPLKRLGDIHKSLGNKKQSNTFYDQANNLTQKSN